MQANGLTEKPMEPLKLPAIMYETGLDEAFLIGSVQELQTLAHRILAALEQLESGRDYFGVHTSQAADQLTSSWGDVCLDGIVVTSTSGDTRRLINAIRINNGEDPIAAEGWPM